MIITVYFFSMIATEGTAATRTVGFCGALEGTASKDPPPAHARLTSGPETLETTNDCPLVPAAFGHTIVYEVAPVDWQAIDTGVDPEREFVRVRAGVKA